MNWIETTVSDITTWEVIYFDYEKVEVCKTICKELGIDCFPSIKKKGYHSIEDKDWKFTELKNSIINENSPVFSEDFIAKMKVNKSNIIFLTNSEFIKGVIHFTNFESDTLYSNLYQNLSLFEKNLRYHLYDVGLDSNDMIKYFNYKIKKSRSSENSYYTRRIQQLEQKKAFKDFEGSYLRDLLNFSVSKFHKPEGSNQIGLGFLKNELKDSNCLGGNRIDNINRLRNLIMHHSDIIGDTEANMYDFNTFEKFFNTVLDFKNAFKELKEIRLKNKPEKIAKSNLRRLTLIESMDKKELYAYFRSL